jgi:MFS family permease
MVETGHAAAASGEPEVAEPTAGMLATLGRRTFAWYFTGQLLSQVGDGIYLVALPFLILGDGGPVRLGVVLACQGITRLAVFPVGGTLADRWSARTVMIGSDAARTVAVLGYALASLVGHVPLWGYIVIAVPFGALDGMFLPASYAVLPELVDDDSLGAANALVSTMQSTAQVTGPAIGGALVGGLKAGAGMVADAVSFAASSLTLLAAYWRRAPQDPVQPATRDPDATAEADPGDGLAPSWRAVLRYVTGSPLLRVSLLVTVVANLAYDGMMEVALPTFSSGRPGWGAGGFGVVMAGFGLGSVLGALGGTVFLRLRRRAVVALVLGIAQGGLVACVPLGSSIVVAVGTLAAAAATQAVLNVFYLTMLQRDVPRRALSRVMSLMMTAAYLTYPLSTLVFGALVKSTGPGVLIAAGGLCISAAFAVGFTSRTYRTL